MNAKAVHVFLVNVKIELVVIYAHVKTVMKAYIVKLTLMNVKDSSMIYK